jgi:ParB/RepB/Spo0J family partition protein
MEMKMPEILLCDVEQLDHDPDNHRRFYDEKDLRSLADTIQINGGVDQALLIRPGGRLDDGRKQYFVIDGNYRLAATRTLGNKAPQLKCELRSNLSRIDKLFMMGRTSEQHYPKDPISEALYFKRLVEEEGISRVEISKKIGCSAAKITYRLALLELDEEVQALVAEKKLPKDIKIVNAFMSIPSRENRVALARELARRKASIKIIQDACYRLRSKLKKPVYYEPSEELLQDGYPNCVAIAFVENPHRMPPAGAKSTWDDVRDQAKEVCKKCDLREYTLRNAEEPGWSLFSHAGDETCDVCNLREIKSTCQGCPLPEYLTRMSRIVQVRKEVSVYELR